MMTRFLGARLGGGAIVLALSLAACNVDEMLQVPDPDVATPISVQDMAALPTVLAGAQADHQVAYNGNTGVDYSIVIGTGLFADELIWAETFPTRFEVDARSIQTNNGSALALYRALHRARQSAVRAAKGFAKFDPANAGYAEALNLEALTYIYFGENYCNGVPFSDVDEAGNQTLGQPITNDAMFAIAVARADSAIKVIGTSTGGAFTTQLQLARVIKARALLDQNQTAAAVTAIGGTAGVPTAFTYVSQHSDNTSRQYNGLYEFVVQGRRFSVGQNEGGNGLPYRTDAAAGDKRIPNANTGITAFDNSTTYFTQLKATARTVTDSVATGIEARLIEAEVDMRAGGPNWVNTLNALRGLFGMPATLTDPGTQTAREDLFFKEREYDLWLTGHRMSDLRRLVRQYGRAQNTVFPSGAYFKGGTYGTDVNFPVPVEENNNPNFHGCTDRNP